MKKFVSASILFCLIFMSGCQEMTEEQPEQQVKENDQTEEGSQETDPQEEEQNETEPQKTEEETVLERADEVISLVKAKDAKELTNHVHKEKGVLFSPYAHIEKDAVTLKKEELVEFFQSQEKRTWGTSDGSGEPIELTPSQYYSEFIYDADYYEADEVVLDPTKARGNLINNVKEIFPTAHIVEYFVEGTEEYDKMDWKALNLVLEKDSTGDWKLVAIVHDQWTI